MPSWPWLLCLDFWPWLLKSSSFDLLQSGLLVSWPLDLIRSAWLSMLPSVNLNFYIPASLSYPSGRWVIKTFLNTELGPRQYCRDNVTMFSAHKMVVYCILSIVVVVTPVRHQDNNIFLIFSCPWSAITLFVVAFKRCRESKTLSALLFTPSLHASISQVR